MAIAKNKLQDIYSAAVTRLAELETSQRQGLSHMYEKYNDTDEVARDDLSKNMSGKQELLNQEIQAFASNSVARIQSAVEIQSSLTKNCLNRCVQNLAVAARKFDEQLNRAKSRQDLLERDSLDELSAQFSAFVEQSLMGFLQVQNEWSQRLRDKHADFRSDLEQAIATSIGGLRQYEHDLTNNIQSAAMENMARLRGAAEQADEQLRATYQEQADKLQAKLEELDVGFQKHHSAVMADAEALARQRAQELSARLDKMYSAPAPGQADLVAKHKSALKTSFESAASVLSNLLEKTREGVSKAAEERAVSIDARGKEVRSRIDSDVETLTQKLNESFEISSKLELNLLKDNEEMSLKMRSDLSNLFESFKKGMDDALDRTVVELSKNSQRAGQELSTACRESQSTINNVSSNVQHEVDTSVSQIIARIRQARIAAVEKVEHAATGNGAPAAATKAPLAPTPDVPQKPAPDTSPAPDVPQPSVSLPTEFFSDAELWGGAVQGDKDDLDSDSSAGGVHE